MNIDILKQRKRQLCGENKECSVTIDRDDMAAIVSLAISGKPITHVSMLIKQMQIALDTLPDNLKPFARAVIEIYSR
jgi:hypothetical protein